MNIPDEVQMRNAFPNKIVKKSIIWVELYLLMLRPNYMLKQEVITNKIAYAGIDCGHFSMKEPSISRYQNRKKLVSK